jgi:predicted O-methyltransferase YrrM
MNAKKTQLRELFPHAWRWICITQRIGGWLTDREANSLFELARLQTPESSAVVVELGSWQGKSSVILAAGLRGKSNPRLFCIDPFGIDENPKHQAEYYDPLIEKMRLNLEDTFQRNIRRCGVADIVVALKGYSYDLVRSWSHPIDMLFIDASHDYECVYRDFILWSAFVKEGGIVALHDVSPNWPGPLRVKNGNLQPPEFGHAQQVDSLAWAFKSVAGMSAPVPELGRFLLPQPLCTPGAEPSRSLIRGLDRATREISVLNSDVARMTAELIERTDAAAKRDDQLAVLRQENEWLEAETRRLSTALEASGQDVQSLQQETKFLRLEIQEVKRDAALRTSELHAAKTALSLEQKTSDDLRRSQERVSGELRQAAHQLNQATHALGALRNSWSWRLTGPLRACLDFFAAFKTMGWRTGPSNSPFPKLLRLGQYLWWGRLIRASGLFDEQYYLTQNPDVARCGLDPLRHFFIFGAAEARNPSPLFDLRYYLNRNPDVARSAVNPVVHYLKWGAHEGRDPHPEFDTSFYLDSNPEARASGLNPLAHYMGPGIACGLDPSPWFDTSEYLESHPEVALLGLNPLVHYLDNRWRQLRNPTTPETPLTHMQSPSDTARQADNALPPYMRLDPRRTRLRESLRKAYSAAGSRDLSGEYDALPLVSVIVPCLNYGYYLEDAILSAMGACSYPLEIVVVDDGSTDPTSIAIVEELTRQYHVRLLRQANTGLAGARLNGFRQSRGKYIQFLDADDFLAPGKIDVQIDMMTRDLGIDIAVCEYQLCDADGEGSRLMEPSTLAGFSFSADDFLLRWERGFSLPFHCALFRREVLDQGQFPPITRKGKEDWIFWITLGASAPRFQFHPDVLATYRIHGHNTNIDRETMGLDFLRAVMYVLQSGLSSSEKFPEASVEHFRTAYLGSIKHDAIVGSRGMGN